MNAIHEGTYRTRMRAKGAWLPVLVRVEYSKDDEGRLADRPRLVLWLGGQRYERPSWYEWGHRLWSIDQREYDRLSHVHTPDTVASDFNLTTHPSLF